MSPFDHFHIDLKPLDAAKEKERYERCYKQYEERMAK